MSSYLLFHPCQPPAPLTFLRFGRVDGKGLVLGIEVSLCDIASQLEHGHAVAVVQSEVESPHYLQQLQHQRHRISIRLAMSLSSFEVQLKVHLFFAALPLCAHLAIFGLNKIYSYIVIINSTNKYRKHKSSMLILLFYSFFDFLIFII